MDPLTLTTAIRKHGVTALLCFCIFWLNNRLMNAESKIDKVEEKLYECLQEASYKSTNTQRKEKREKTFQASYAIIPTKYRYGIKRKMAV